MNMGQRPATNRGFSLVELLIVVIILAILAAIVVPQFADTTNEARASAIESNLATMRSAIQLYRQQHGTLPGAVTAAGGTCPAGSTAGTGTGGAGAQGELAFISQLTLYSSMTGQTCTGTDGTFNMGPYLREIPVNPANNLGTVEVVGAGILGGLTPDGGHGWKFDIVSGELIADNN
ncbi:MAG TPA: prepilin-type N-terminal cleavage/methylation domain-containing protein [Gammaproteobacteria bacterium]|nr:prepilin-type N-terminal cleavage/methylation domain-containing protein [Gammaproteobacteria bacterium]